MAKPKLRKYNDRKDALPSVNAATLAALCDLTAGRITQLVTDGVLAAAVDGKYPLPESCAVIMRSQKARTEKNKGLDAKKELLLDERIDRAKFDTAVVKGEYKNVSEFSAKLFNIGEEIKASLYFHLLNQIPGLCAGKSAEDIKRNCEQVMRGVLKRWQEFANNACPPPKG